MGQRIAKKVLWIGWDAADWKVINPMIDQGLMPNLERMVNTGTMGNLATLDPPMSPTLWTSMSTGKRPYKHGIHGFTEVDPSGTGVRPSYITSRKVKAIWNMLMHHDMITHQVGWWPSHPAEPTNGVYISNFWHKAGNNPHDWPLKEGSVHPISLEETFKGLRVHPAELTFAHLQPFLPLGYKMDQNDPFIKGMIQSVRKITADAASIQAAVTYVLDHHDYDLCCVYFDAIDHYGHGFMKYHPPRRPHIPEEYYKYFNYVVTAGYRYHDMILGRLLDMAGDDTTVFLVSDHGFHPDHLRPVSLPIRLEPAAPALEHSPYGIIVAKGPGIKKDERIYGASLIDMCPTILSVLGLPVARDFDGKVLMNLFEKPLDVDIIDSWEEIEGECGQHAKEATIDVDAAKEELQQLIDLGYIEDPGGNTDKAIESTEKTNKYFMARAFMDGGRVEDALPLYMELWEEYRENSRFGIRLINCYLSLSMIEKARDVMDDVIELHIDDKPSLHILNGTILMREKKFKKALDEFEFALEKNPTSVNLNLQVASGYMKMKKFKKAKEAVEKELEVNRESPEAHRMLGAIYLTNRKPEEAAESFLTAIGLKYHFPLAHFNLGNALLQMKAYENAAMAFQISAKQSPQFEGPRRSLAKLYSTHLPDEEKRKFYEQALAQANPNKKEILIVSGYRRSGTSLLMSLLNDEGIPLYVNDRKPKDEHNPNGYYEHSDVSAIRYDKGFLASIPEKTVVKIFASELPYLPKRYKYKVVFVERDSLDIIHSRQKVKGKKQGDVISVAPIIKLDRRQKRISKWLENQENITIEIVQYKDLLTSKNDALKTVLKLFQI